MQRRKDKRQRLHSGAAGRVEGVGGEDSDSEGPEGGGAGNNSASSDPEDVVSCPDHLCFCLCLGFIMLREHAFLHFFVSFLQPTTTVSFFGPDSVTAPQSPQDH